MPEQTDDLLARIVQLARVPEHSPGLMQAMSQGMPFCVGDYFFIHDEDWLMAVAYPLRGTYSHAAFEVALTEAVRRCGGEGINCWAVGPDLPPRLQPHVMDRDRFHVLPAAAQPPARLRSALRRASQCLHVEEGTVFTAEHRRLWAEFLGRADRGEAAPLAPHVRELYARTPEALDGADGHLRLLDARDGQGRLVACLLLDYAPQNFVAYILGAHSRTHYVPHAADLLFAAMLERARTSGKRFIHLGLGVNEGILRFKKKWGAVPSWPYLMADWRQEAPRSSSGVARELALAFLRSGSGVSKRQLLAQLVEQRPFAMLWQVEKAGRVSWIGGTAHFFRYSFEDSFRKLFREVDNVIFEGPLDDTFMVDVDRNGKSLPPGSIPLLEQLTEEEIRQLERVVRGAEGPWLRRLNMESPKKADVRDILGTMRPWCAFFSLWTAFLERMGWRSSVDMEAWRIARDMGRNVMGMENLEEQLASLNSVPVERVLAYFRDCRSWPVYARRNLRAYLAGDLERMMGSSAEFPTRTGTVISVRDQRFRERMRPWMEEGRTAVFVGAAHMLNLRWMLAEDGFRLRRCLPTLGHRLRAALRHEKEVIWW
ncbi:MAG: TraB/GumN family protein [Desulfovibrio sp.]|nr:TraB/GumN family protein [Desulfovibrio sp.]